jgi:hypothetical protein
MAATGVSRVIELPRSGKRPRGRVRLSGIRRDEFVFPSSKVVIEADVPLDATAVGKSLGVERVDNLIRFSRDSRSVTWSPAENLAPGRHVLRVGPVLSADGKELSPGIMVPFQFVRTAARIPRDTAVESMVRLTTGGRRLSLYDSARGRYVEIMKATSRESGEPLRLAFDEAGNRVDGERFLADLERKRLGEGKLQPALRSRLRRVRADEAVHVAVWAALDDDVDPNDKREAERLAPRAAEPRFVAPRRKAMRERTQQVGGLVEGVGGKELRMDDAAPVVFAKVPKRAVQELAARDEVAGVFLYEPEGIEDLQDSIDVANSDDVHDLGVEGSGVKVAVWENGPTSTANLVIEARYTSSPTTSDHSENVHAIIKNREQNEPHGHAPECLLHSANSKDLDALRWAVKDKGCTVINQSFHRSSEPESGELSFDDVYKDWLILHWPYPTICQAAGNYWEDDPDDIDPPSDEFVNHKGYNSLAVGNHDDTAAAMASSSVFRNPTSSHGDRELPEIAANGTSVEADDITMTGTSQASPAAAGVAALIQSASSTLKVWPEGCRAILLAASTRNIVGDTWWQDVIDGDDASDGAGAMNALESFRITQNRRGRNNAPSRRGWDVGTLDSNDFGAGGLSTFSYRVQVPRLPFFAPRHVKVALAWDSKVTTFSIPGVTIPISSQLTVDLDLKVFDRNGNQVAAAASYDNSYEIAEFDAIPGQTYDIRVRRWSGTDWTWYGIAWTVTGGIIDLIAILRESPVALGRLGEVLERMEADEAGGESPGEAPRSS